MLRQLFIFAMIPCAWVMAQDVQKTAPGTAKGANPEKAPPVAPSGQGQPKMVITNEEVDLGTIKEGQSADAVFHVKNEGDAVLEISEVRASCGCTTPKLTEDQKRIEPGGAIDLSATFNSAGRRGPQTKSLTITSNDPANPRKTVTFKTTVKSIYTMTPEPVGLLGHIRRGQRVERSLELMPEAENTTLEIESTVFDHPYVTLTDEPLTKDARTGRKLNFVVSEGAPMGMVNAQANVKLKIGDERTEARLNVTGQVAGDLMASPAQVNWGNPVLPGKPFSQFMITALGEIPVKILDYKAGPGIQAKLNEDPQGKRHTLQLSAAEDAKPGPVGSFVDVYTDSYWQSHIRVPVYLEIQPDLTVEPLGVYLAKDGKDETTQKRVITLESPLKTAIQLGDEVQVSIPEITAKIVKTPVEDRMQKGMGPMVERIEVAIADKASPGMYHGLVTVDIRQPSAQKLVIPVIASVTEKTHTPTAKANGK